MIGQGKNTKNKPLLRTVTLFALAFIFSSFTLFAQEGDGDKKSIFKGFVVSGEIQTDILVPENDSIIGAEIGDHRFRSNSYVGVRAQNQYFEAGIRGEYMKQPLPGFESNFAGAGVPNIYLRGRYKALDLTAGDFYE